MQIAIGVFFRNTFTSMKPKYFGFHKSYFTEVLNCTWNRPLISVIIIPNINIYERFIVIPQLLMKYESITYVISVFKTMFIFGC